MWIGQYKINGAFNFFKNLFLSAWVIPPPKTYVYFIIGQKNYINHKIQIRMYFVELPLLHTAVKYPYCLDTATLEEDILPALILGLKDTNPVIVSQTLR